MAKRKDGKKNKSRKDTGKPGSKARKITDKANKSKKHTTSAFLPVVLIKNTEDQPMCENEISYRDSLLAIEMEKLAAKGLNNDQIIKELGISRDTFYKKIKNEPYFSYALFKHRHIANHNVENSLYQRAVGYKVLEKTTEAKPIKKVDSEGKPYTTYELMTAKLVEKELPGDVKAQEFYLTNRMPDQYKKKVEPIVGADIDMSLIQFRIKRRGE